MRRFLSNASLVSLLSGLIMASLLTAADAQTLTVLHSFTGGWDGAFPLAGLTIDATGNLYGTAVSGGTGNCGYNYAQGCGVVFRLQRHGSGWLFTSLYSFSGPDGFFPQGRVGFGPDGTLYGTTNGTPGTLFRLRPPMRACAMALCPWSMSIVHQFSGGSDGAFPAGDLTFDAAGNIYGTTSGGGSSFEYSGYGVVYEMSGGVETVLHAFYGSDGGNPQSGVIFDAAGNLYGTAPQDGMFAPCGTVFELLPSPSGWTETLLHNFVYNNDGCMPVGGLLIDSSGSLYGTTASGEPYRRGTIFELTCCGWGEIERYVFGGPQGQGPTAGLTMDAAGNLYGTTYSDGRFYAGSVFRLAADGSFSELHAFNGSDGQYPVSNVVLDTNGNLYGTTSEGGAYGYGAVWEITP